MYFKGSLFACILLLSLLVPSPGVFAQEGESERPSAEPERPASESDRQDLRREGEPQDRRERFFWVQRAFNSRYSMDRSGVTPSYHAGMLPFARGPVFYGEGVLHFTGNFQNFGFPKLADGIETDLGQFGTYDTEQLKELRLGAALPLGSRFGLGVEVSTVSIYESMGDYAVNIANYIPKAKLSLGARLTERLSLGITGGFLQTDVDLGSTQETQSEELEFSDGFLALGVVWADEERDIWAGMRAVSDLLQNRPSYFVGKDIHADPIENAPVLLIETSAPWRTETFFRGGLFDSRLLVSYVGGLDWYWGDRYSDMEVRLDPTGGGYGYIETWSDMLVLHRDIGVEFRLHPSASLRLGYNRRDCYYILDLIGGEGEEDKRISGHGFLLGGSLHLEHFLVDLTLSHSRPPIEAAPWEGAKMEGLWRMGLGLVWKP